MNILKALSNHYYFPVSWDGETLNDNLHLFYTKEKLLSSLPFFVLWECWKACNRELFEGTEGDNVIVVSRILGAFQSGIN